MRREEIYALSCAVMMCCAGLCPKVDGGIVTPYMSDDVLYVQFDDIDVFDAFGDSDNLTAVIDVNEFFGFAPGTQSTVTGIAWNVSIQSESTSWLSDVSIHFDDADARSQPGDSAFTLVPGLGDDFSGFEAYTTSGIQDLGDDLSASDIVLSEGHLRLEFFDASDDFVDAADAVITGRLEISAVPVPGSVCVLAIVSALSGRHGSRRRAA